MDQETATPPVIDAPAPEATAPVAETAAPAEPRSTEERMAEAFAAAETAAKQDPPKAPESKTPAPKEPEQPAGTSQEPPQTNRNRTPEEGALDRALSLRRQGRESELSPRAQRALADYDGEIRGKAIEEYRTTQATEARMRQVFLTLESERMTDPVAFSQKVLENPDIGVFHRSYRQEHPDVSLENPSAPRQRTEQEIARELTEAYGKGFESTFDRIADDAGLSDEAIASLKAEFKFGAHPDSAKLGTYLGKLVTEAVKTATKESRARVTEVETENTALKQEVTALKTRGLQTPSHIPGSLSAPGSSSGPTRGTVNDRMLAAAAEARERVGAA